MSPDAAMQVTDLLDPADFYLDRNGLIYAAVLELTQRREVADFVTVSAELDRRRQLADIGGPAYLTQLITAVPTSMHALHYARLVQRASLLRRLIQAAGEITQLAYSEEHSLDDVLRLALKRLESAVPAGLAEDALLAWKDSFMRWMEWQERRVDARGRPKVDLPWRSLSWVRPLRPGMLAVVAALPGMGKTIFAECCADHWARNGFKVAFFHYELSHQIMLDRRMCRWVTGLAEPMLLIEAGELSEAMHNAADVAYVWPGAIHYIHCDGWSVPRAAAQARRMISNNEADVVIVDYLQKAPYREVVKGINPAQMRGQDVEVLKSLAEREQIPVLLLSQMSREATHERRKTGHTIRDTGEALDKANLVITLHRDILDEPRDGYQVGDMSPIVRVRVDKQTLGRTGEGELVVNPRKFLMGDVVRD